MKKILILLITILFLTTGCGEYKLENAINDFTKKVEGSKSYELSGTMEISNGEELFTYDMNVLYLKEDYYKVTLVNQTNKHEQVILKNNDGLYVQTHKSFKQNKISI